MNHDGKRLCLFPLNINDEKKKISPDVCNMHFENLTGFW